MRSGIHSTILSVLWLGCCATWATAADLTWPARLPIYDHIVIVVEENKDYDEILGSPHAPYINSVLKAEGANLTRMFAEEHNSQGNYFWLFSGSNQNVGYFDIIPDESNNANYPFQSSNLGFQLIKTGRSFKGYSESLPAVGSEAPYTPDGFYARKHVPWVSFGNLPQGSTVESSCHLRMSDFPTDSAHFSNLPTVAIVVPNLTNDMHDGASSVSIPRGDTWLKDHFDHYYQWAKTHNSLLIVTFDENEAHLIVGLTNPFTDPKNTGKQNRIPTLLAGAHIQHGEFGEGNGVTHVNLLRTLEAMYGLPKSGNQQPHAAKGGISDDQIITDIFQPSP